VECGRAATDVATRCFDQPEPEVFGLKAPGGQSFQCCHGALACGDLPYHRCSTLMTRPLTAVGEGLQRAMESQLVAVKGLP